MNECQQSFKKIFLAKDLIIITKKKREPAKLSTLLSWLTTE